MIELCKNDMEREIIYDLSMGMTYQAIGEQHGMSRQAIHEKVKTIKSRSTEGAEGLDLLRKLQKIADMSNTVMADHLGITAQEYSLKRRGRKQFTNTEKLKVSAVLDTDSEQNRTIFLEGE
jgi:predicted DNA-binding protein YlxM (UPF0122 family)